MGGISMPAGVNRSMYDHYDMSEGDSVTTSEQFEKDCKAYGRRVAFTLYAMPERPANTIRTNLDTLNSCADVWRKQCLRERYRVSQWRERYAEAFGQEMAASAHDKVEHDTREVYGAPAVADQDSAYRYERTTAGPEPETVAKPAAAPEPEAVERRSWSALFDGLGVGDAFDVATGELQRTYQAASYHSKRLGRRFTVKQIDGRHSRCLRVA